MDEKKSWTRKILWLILYLMTMFINDEFGIGSMLGVITAFMLVGFPKYEVLDDINTKNIGQKPYNRGRKIITKTFVIVLLIADFFFSYYLRIFRRDLFNFGGIAMGSINLVNSFVIYIEVVAVFIYYVVLEKKNILKMGKRALLFIIVMIIPFLIKDCLYASYGIFLNHIRYDAREYFNLAYRAFMLAAFTEELFYRGMVFDELKKYCSPISSELIQAALFTLVHSERWILLFKEFDILIAINLFAVFFMGFLASRLRERTGSIVPGIVMHAALNGGIYDIFIAVLSMN